MPQVTFPSGIVQAKRTSSAYADIVNQLSLTWGDMVNRKASTPTVPVPVMMLFYHMIHDAKSQRMYTGTFGRQPRAKGFWGCACSGFVICPLGI